MASRSTRQNNTDEKLLAAIKRNNKSAEQKPNFSNKANTKLAKETEERLEMAREKVERLKNLRLLDDKKNKKKGSSRK